MTKINQANFLKVAAVAIAAPRYAGAFGAAIGLDVLQSYPWLAPVEIATGAAMAILEGFALAFVLARWRLLVAGRGLQWYILLAFILLLAASLPAVAVPYLLIEQNNSLMSELFAGRYWLQIAWSFLVAGVPMLVVMAVGFADMPDEAEVSERRATERAKIERSRTTVERITASERATRRAEQERTVSELQPFMCDACGRTFARQNGLNGHRAHCEPATNGHHAEQSIEDSKLGGLE